MACQYSVHGHLIRGYPRFLKVTSSSRCWLLGGVIPLAITAAAKHPPGPSTDKEVPLIRQAVLRHAWDGLPNTYRILQRNSNVKRSNYILQICEIIIFIIVNITAMWYNIEKS